MGVLTTIDRAALAAYCQSYAKWVEAEQRLKETPPLLKSPSGYVQQSPWMAISNKQLRAHGALHDRAGDDPGLAQPGDADPRMHLPQTITFTTVYEDKPSNTMEVQFVSPPEQPG